MKFFKKNKGIKREKLIFDGYFRVLIAGFQNKKKAGNFDYLLSLFKRMFKFY